jgi:hypothetical protein
MQGGLNAVEGDHAPAAPASQLGEDGAVARPKVEDVSPSADVYPAQELRPGGRKPPGLFSQ